jgi:hypothetical protein
MFAPSTSVLFCVGRQKVIPHSTAVPAMTLLGYSGILAKPAAIVLIIHLSNLSFALGAAMLTSLHAAGNTRRLEN